ncbi:MAG TPA: winged helix-turn-helix domain-containing protein [Candidatus Binatia bacterium]|nr:winged helix-turn-helix domain-containing protein [Candidatus Binatia bacterium]
MATNRLAPGSAEAIGRIWTFSGRTFDESRLELSVGDRAVELELKPLEVLVYLLQHAGEVVSKNELLDAVWPGLNVVEGSLSTAVYKLRKALADEDGSIIVTVPKVGYRLAPVAHADMGRLSSSPGQVSLAAGMPVPGREHWRLLRPLDASASRQIWLAQHPKTYEHRVFKFVSSLARLRTLKREVTVFRFLSESLEDRLHLVQILEWNFDVEPYFLESEYGGPNLAQWAEERGGLLKVPLQERLNILGEISSALAAVHAVGVVHKDLKPANVLVSRLAGGEEQIRIADFGSALLLEPSRLEALGITRLGLTQTGTLESTSLSGTLLYLAPELFSGKAATAQSDVYALGVMLYQMVIGDFRRPLSPGWEEEVPDPLLREDIAAAVCGDPGRRLRSPAELAARLENLEDRRAERARIEVARQQQELADRKRTEARARRPWIALAVVMLFTFAASLYFLHRRPATPAPAPLKAVAVLPFQNVGSDRQFDYLSLPLADEVASMLSYARGLSVQPFVTTSQYARPNIDPRKAGAEMHAASIVTGRFLPVGDQLHLTLEAIDVKTGRVLWADTLDAAARNMIELREKIVARTQGVLAAALGGSAYTVKGTRPTNNEAYELYLRALSMPLDSGTNQQALAMLERSVALDPNFAPAWLSLGRRCYVEGRYGKGGSEMNERYTLAVARAVALDPDYLPAVANWIGMAIEEGDETKAMQQAEDLVRRHADSSDAHYILSYALRYAGITDEATRQCDLAFQIDPNNRMSGLRSCAILPALRGDYHQASEILQLADPGSDFAKAILLLGLLRGGNEEEALRLGAPHIQQWPSYDMLIACLQHKPAAEIGAIAAKVKGSVDPEANYLAAANLAYCGRNAEALALLSKAVEGHYCSYPVMDSDPFFTGVRGIPEFAKIRADAIACQQNFASEWRRIQRQPSR